MRTTVHHRVAYVSTRRITKAAAILLRNTNARTRHRMGACRPGATKYVAAVEQAYLHHLHLHRHRRHHCQRTIVMAWTQAATSRSAHPSQSGIQALTCPNMSALQSATSSSTQPVALAPTTVPRRARRVGMRRITKAAASSRYSTSARTHPRTGACRPGATKFVAAHPRVGATVVAIRRSFSTSSTRFVPKYSRFRKL